MEIEVDRLRKMYNTETEITKNKDKNNEMLETKARKVNYKTPNYKKIKIIWLDMQVVFQKFKVLC